MIRNLFCVLIGVVIGLGIRMIADIIRMKFRPGWPDTSRPIPDPPPKDH